MIENNHTSGSINEHGIYVSNSGDRPDHPQQRLFGNHGSGIHMNGDISQGGDGIISGALVTGNIIYNNGIGGGSGINMDGVQNSRIENNLLYNNHASGISLYQIDGRRAGARTTSSSTTRFTLPSDGRWDTQYSRIGSTGNTVLNNIFDHRACHARGASIFRPTACTGFYERLQRGESAVHDKGGDSFLSLAQWRHADRAGHALDCTRSRAICSSKRG